MNHIYSTGQVARLLGLKPYQIEYAHANGLLAEPAHRFLGKRAYAPDDVRRVADYFGVTLGDDLTGVEAGKEGA